MNIRSVSRVAVQSASRKPIKSPKARESPPFPKPRTRPRSDSREDLWKSLNGQPEALDRFEDLGRSAKHDYAVLTAQLSRRGSDEAQTQLVGLLATGLLSRKDGTGQTVLENMLRLSKQESNSEIAIKASPLEQLIHQLTDPESIHQGSRDTCSVTTVEYMLATNQPGEYSRLAAEVFKEEDRLEWADGTSAYRPLSSLAADNTSRSALSRVLQSTLMEEVNGVFQYDNQTDRHKTVLGIERPWPGVLSPWAMGELLTKTMGERYETKLRQPKLITKLGLGANQNLSRLLDNLGSGSDIPVSLAWGNGGHVLLLQGEDKEGNYLLRNPWGNSERGQDVQGAFPVEREVSDVGLPSGGLIKMSHDELERYLLAYWVPEQSGATQSASSSRR